MVDTAKSLLDEIALFASGAYLIDLDLLDHAKSGSERAQELTRKTEAEQKLLDLCQQWNGEGNAEEYLIAAIRAQNETVRQDMIVVLQELGYIENEVDSW